MHYYDAATLAWLPWDGSLTAGAVTIGIVNQGTGGSSAWKVDGSASTQPVSGTLGTKETPDATSTYAAINADSTAYAASLVIKASAGKLITLIGYSSKTSAQFIQLHNAAAPPADGAVPVVVVEVPAASTFSFDYSPWGRFFSTGVVACNSSTAATKTIGAADTWFSATVI